MNTPSSSSLPSNFSRRGFTLIELLTVIAIIGVLAAILVPVVGKVRSSARASTTVSNLRQLQVANLSYANENKGFLVPNWPESSAAYQNGWWQYQPYLNHLGVPPPADGSPHHGWDNSPRIARSGQAVEPLNTDGKKGDAFGTIAMNMSRFSHYTGGARMQKFPDAHTRTGMMQLSTIVHPDSFIVFSDAAGYAITYDRRAQWVNDDPSNGHRAMAFRNGGKAKVAVASGAVKSLTLADVTPETVAVQRMFYYDGVR